MEAASMEAAVAGWHQELSQLLANLSTTTGGRHQAEESTRNKLNFRLQNCIDVDQETSRVSFMALASNVIINIPILASLVAELPLNKDVHYFELEILTQAEQGTLVIGLVDKEFTTGKQPGSVPHSFGYHALDGSVYIGGKKHEDSPSGERSTSCVVGDRIGCGVDFSDDAPHHLVYFTRNGLRVVEGLILGESTESSEPATEPVTERVTEPVTEPAAEPTADWYPALSLTALKEEVRLIQEAPWRSDSAVVAHKNELKVNKESGQIVYRSTRKGGQVSTLLAALPFSTHFAFFEIEILALSEGDEVAVGGVPEEYSTKHLPGVRGKSVGYLGVAGGMFGGRNKKIKEAPKVSVGDKMGCGVETRAGGVRHLYFTHNSETFDESELNDNCPAHLYPALGLKSSGGTVSVCIQDSSNWTSAGEDQEAGGDQSAKVDMSTEVDSEPGVILVDRDTARASYVAPVGFVRDAVLVATQPLSAEISCFEIEIMYGSLVTVGLVPDDFKAVNHPGFTPTSIGYNAEIGQVFMNGEIRPLLLTKTTCTYGDRISCGARLDITDGGAGKQIIYFNKNGVKMCEVEFGDVNQPPLRPALGMRSSGQALAIKLVDRALWNLPPKEVPSNSLSTSIDRELIECPICRDIFRDPRVFPCSVHSFCADCIKCYMDQHRGKRVVPCPICRQPCNIPAGGYLSLPINPLLTRLLEMHVQLNAAG